METPQEATIGMQRLVGKIAVLLTFIYLMILISGAARLARGIETNPVTWGLFLLPAVAFVPAVVDGVKLHRTLDPERLKPLWRHCALYTLIGLVLLIATAYSIIEVNGS
ncbi:hypothetical protein Acy02nite_02280 [Actinoplanes cyaneus]|uniref:Uncharacterized protein n=1 Tax=Actinoplanes cyaneus TaxID=52696 RepID=A0A919M1F7_9ACTN|nr:hypothetical protein [Actinoplanes cyaneus]MCW2143565.1 hypothetical protein [Actinoplanes cyaneus]GID62347.1 hypothetical protein Acy02nite_02280 [Actinoplanes cyaneus]